MVKHLCSWCSVRKTPALGVAAQAQAQAQAIAIVLVAFLLWPGFAQAQSGPPEGSIITSQAAVLDEASHKAFIVDTQKDALSIIDSSSHVTTLGVGKAPIALALNPVTHRIYVENHGSGTVSVIDGKSDKVVATITVDKLPYSIAVDPQTNQIFVSSVYSSALKIIDGATNAVSSLKGVSADAMAINASAGLVYLLSYESTDLTVFHIASRTFSKIPIGATHLWAMARNPSTNVLYVTRIGNADVVAYDETTHASRIIKTGSFPCAVAVNRLTNKVYVVNYGDETVSVMDGAANSLLATVPVGDHPQSIAVNEATNEIYIANVHGNSLTVLDGSRDIVIRTVGVGQNPYGVVVDKKTGEVVTANQGEPSFTLVDPARLHARDAGSAAR